MFINNIKNKKGFTLIELLVVISIISLLSSIVLTSLNGARAKARDVKRKAEIDSIITALTLYYDSHNIFPGTSYSGACGTAIDGTTDLVSTSLKSDNLMSKLPTVSSNSGTCGDSYYTGTWNSAQNIAVLTKLENADSNCKSFNPSTDYYITGSYCNGFYIKVLP